MSTRPRRRRCKHPDCTTQTKARTRLCPSHRPAVTVTAHSGQVQISTTETVMTYAAAIQLADELVDAVERNTTL